MITSRFSRTTGILFMTLFVFVACVSAQEKMGEMKKEQETKGVQGAFLRQSAQVEQQFVSLADAVPQEKYAWRPAEGVRSLAESFLHVARGNYGTMNVMGAKLPEGVDPQTIETSTTDKKKIIEEIKRSFKAANDYIRSIPDSDLNRQVNFFGSTVSVLDMVMLAATHQHEVLGQSIAYARTNGVVPPWTAERDVKMKEEKKN